MTTIDRSEDSDFEGSCASDSRNAVDEDPEAYGYGAWYGAHENESEEIEEQDDPEVLPESGKCLHCLGPCSLSRGFLCTRCDRGSR